MNVGSGAGSIAVNPLTNQIYVPSTGGFSVIDGATNTVATSTLPDAQGYPVAANPVTNTFYLTTVHQDPECGKTSCPEFALAAVNGTTGVSSETGAGVFFFSEGIAANPTTNQIYVAAKFPAVIEGATNALNRISSSFDAGRVDVNPVTNEIYFAGGLLTVPGGPAVAVVDGSNNTVTATLTLAASASAVAVNPITNEIYLTIPQNGTVSVIDGATSAITTIPVGSNPFSLAINPVTNKIYVANNGSNNITVIDGATNATTTLTDSTASGPNAVAVDALTNQIYVANSGSATVTVINGSTNALTSIILPNASGTAHLALDPVTNIVYALNGGSNNVSVIAGVAGTGAPDFAIGTTSGSLTLSSSGQATDTIIVGPPYGSTVDLTCNVSGPTPAPTCELSASSLTPGPTYGTATLTITAPTAAAMLAPSHQRRLGGFYAACFPLLFGITLLGGSKRRGTWLLAGFLLVLLILLSSCGGGSQNTGGETGPQSYTVTITGTSGAIQHSTQVTVTVQ